MRIPERYWWLMVLFGCVAAGGVVFAPIYILSLLVPLDQELGYSLTPDFLLAAAAVLVILVLAALLLGSGLRGRVRYRRRRAALAGDLAAIPLAQVPSALLLPDLVDGPLVLSWRASKQLRFVTGPLFTLIIALEGAALVVFSGIGIYSAVRAYLTGATLTRQDVNLYGLSLISLVVVVVGGAMFVRYVPTIFGRPFGVRASAEGIEQRTQEGRSIFIRWEDIRLFEMEASRTGSRRYWVYGHRNIVDWQNAPGGLDDFILDGLSAGELVLRLDALVALVRAKTGLAPRTFSKRFRAPEETTPSATPGSASGARNEARATLTLTIFGIAFALVTGALGVAVWLLPLTSSTPLNGAIALPLIAQGVVLLVVLLVRLARGAASSQFSPLLAPPAGVETPTSNPDDVYALAFTRALPLRLVLALLSAPLLIDLVSVVLLFTGIFSTTFGVLFGIALPSLLPGISLPVAYVVSVYGFLGVSVLAYVLRNRPTTVRADALGLSVSTGAAVALPWASIGGVEEKLRQGQVVAYVACERDGARSISWPARETTWQRIVPARGAQPITPEQLACLVLRRGAAAVPAGSSSWIDTRER